MDQARIPADPVAELRGKRLFGGTKPNVLTEARRQLYRWRMKPDDAVARLKQLAVDARITRESTNWFWADAWVAKVRDVVARSLGPEHDLVTKLDSPLHGQAQGKINAGCALIDSAIYSLEIAKDEPQPVDPASFDTELWDHMNGLVSTGDWGKIPSTAATFVEHIVRVWSGSGSDMYGKGLYGYAFGDAGPLRLGRRNLSGKGGVRSLPASLKL